MPSNGTLQQIVRQLNNGTDGPHRWNTLDLTFSFLLTLPTEDQEATGDSFTTFNAQQKSIARWALAAYSDVITVHFTEVSGAAGDIRFGNLDLGQNTAHAGYPGPGSGGDAFFSSTPVPSGVPDLLHPVIGQHAYLTYLHELGHAMGLHHMGNYNGGSPSYAVDALFAQDTEQFSVMSYFQSQDAANGNNQYNASGVHIFAQTLMLYDIAALQATYGANPDTRSGATVYGFNSNIAAESPYNFSGNHDPNLCIYDAGGRDRLDFSGYSGPTTINLAPGSFSDTDSMAQNVSIAFGTVIEDATGGSGADQISGNFVSNGLRGGNGHDSLRGMQGDDRLIGGNGNDSLIGGDGADRLTGGHGSDAFCFNVTPSGTSDADTITDFNHAADRFRVDGAAFGGLGQWTAAAFFASAAGHAHDASDRFIYETDTGKLFFDADGNQANSVAAILIATLINIPTVDWTDFFIL